MSKHHLLHRQNPSVRRALYKKIYDRDKGFCNLCGKDNSQLLSEILKLQFLQAIELAWSHEIPVKRLYEAAKTRRLGRIWEVDHIIPLGDGGPTEPENLRTLCCVCHSRITKERNQQIAKICNTP